MYVNVNFENYNFYANTMFLCFSFLLLLLLHGFSIGLYLAQHIFAFMAMLRTLGSLLRLPNNFDLHFVYIECTS